jgi:hypothetical protein
MIPSDSTLQVLGLNLRIVLSSPVVNTFPSFPIAKPQVYP